MIVTTGAIIKIQTVGSMTLERNSETPGVVSVTALGGINGAIVFYLPANEQESNAFIEAYRRILEEPIEYRKVVVE